VYPGGSVVEGEVVESTREVIVRFLVDMMVRGTTRDDKLHMFAIFPFMNGAAVQTGDWAANEWKRLRHSPLKKDIRQMKAGWHEADLGEMTSVKVRKRSMYKHIFVSEPAMTMKGLMWLLEHMSGVDAWVREQLLVPMTDYMAGRRGMVTAAPGCVTTPTMRTVNRRAREMGPDWKRKPSKATMKVAARGAHLKLSQDIVALINGRCDEAEREHATDPLFSDALLATVKLARDTLVNAALRLRDEAVGAKRKRVAVSCSLLLSQ
jgi:hypothetical protein